MTQGEPRSDSGAADPGVGQHRGVQGGLAGVGETLKSGLAWKAGQMVSFSSPSRSGGGTLLSASSSDAPAGDLSLAKPSLQTGSAVAGFTGCGEGAAGHQTQGSYLHPRSHR